MMSKRMNKVHRAKNRKLRKNLGLRAIGLALPAAGGLMLAGAPAHAYQLYDGSISGNNNWEVSLDTTLSYAGMYRVGSPSATLVSGTLNTNGNDGDANFRHGLVSNLFEILPVLDIKNGDFGMHFSGDYFINTVYLQGNQNNQPADSLNSFTSSKTSFAPATATAEGHNGRLLDAFVYNSWHFGEDQELTFKAGKQTLFWGQSLYSQDAISSGQAPIDSIAAQNIINPQSQQIFLPVGQAVITYKPNLTYTLQAYYQFEWEPTELQGAGAFLSNSDVLGPGGNVIYLPGGISLPRIKAITPPSQNGQFGASVQAQYGNYDVGLFALRYDSKNPSVLQINANTSVTPTGLSVTGGYQVVYPRDIWILGTSLGTTIGATNIGAEFSVHLHAPLTTLETTNVEINGVPSAALSTANNGNANGNPGYPVGDVATGLVNFIYGSPSLPFDPGGILMVGEVDYVDVFRVTANKSGLAAGRSSAASSFDLSVTPTYNQVLPFLTLTFPVSISTTYAGNSQFDATMNHGVGQFSAGIGATYRSVWTATLSYVAPFGKVTTNALLPESGLPTVDRKYIELNIQRTF